MKLIVDEGSYESESLIGLLIEVLRHRLSHFIKGQGFRD
jgi:hypothetical protein